MIIEELAEKVRAEGGGLAVVDVCEYFNRQSKTLLNFREDLSETLRRFCDDKDIGYVDLAEHLLKANASGRSMRWTHDGHFNEAGNEIFAEALYRWRVDHDPLPPR